MAKKIFSITCLHRIPQKRQKKTPIVMNVFEILNNQVKH